jgi:hypothetical protein
VFVDSNGAFEMSGGTIAGNSAIDGGGVFAREDGYAVKFDENGDIAVFPLNPSVFRMSGGTIAGNAVSFSYGANGRGGGVFVAYDGSFLVSGSPVVAGNTNELGVANDVYLYSGAAAAVEGAFAEGARIGVATDLEPEPGFPVLVARGATEGDAAYFFSDSLSYGVEFVNGELCLTFGGVYPEYVFYADDVVKANWLAWAARTGAGTNVAYEAAFLLDLAPAELDAPTGALLRVAAIVPTAAGCRLELESGIRGLFQPDGKEGTCYLCNGVLALEFAENLEEQETGWALRLVDAAIEDGRAVVEFVFYDGEPAPDALFLRPSIRSSVPKN